MNLVSLAIPGEFIAPKARLTWREVRFGIVEELLSLDAPSEIAAELLATEADPAPAVVELACLERGESVRPALDKLANAEPEASLDEIRAKWLFLVLAWVFEHKADFEKPLQTVEMIYADFDHPEAIAGFVAYMPATEPVSPDLATNEARLYAKWEAWLAERAAFYAPSAG